MPTIEFLNLNHYYNNNKQIYQETFDKLMTTGHFILGENVRLFEESFARFCKTQYAFGVGNGLDALVIALKALGIKSGDEVIVPAHTFIATWLAVSAVGAVPVPVEVSEDSFNINPEKINSAISKKTKAIIGVHLYGRPFEAKKLQDICKQNDLYLIEDAAQAHGADCDGLRVGSIGDIACFSFYPGKNLGAFGDGGGITTNSETLAKKISMLRNYGSAVKYKHEILGMNSRLDELLAGFLRLRLKDLEKENLYRNQLAEIYRQELSSISVVTLPTAMSQGQQVWHLFVIRTKKRNQLADFLKARDIQTLIHYPIPCHLSGGYSDHGFKKGQFPVSESISDTCLSLPIGPHLTMEQVTYVAQNIRSFFA